MKTIVRASVSILSFGLGMCALGCLAVTAGQASARSGVGSSSEYATALPIITLDPLIVNATPTHERATKVPQATRKHRSAPTGETVAPVTIHELVQGGRPGGSTVFVRN